MTNQHPIIPPFELVQQWLGEHYGAVYVVPGEATSHVATQAARWGADQELEACCEQLRTLGPGQQTIDRLRIGRRPKPPSLKERLSKAIIEGDERGALKLLEELDD